MVTFTREHAVIAAVVASYFFVSISLVFVNKELMTPGSSIPAPLFVTWFQCLITAVIIYNLGLLAPAFPSKAWLKEFTPQQYHIPTAKQVLPLTLFFVGMVTFNNLCLQYVEVSFYNVARSLTIVFNVIFTYLFLKQTTSYRTMACLMLVIFGFFAGARGELRFSLIGTVFGVMSSCFVSMNSIQTKKVLPVVNKDKWALAFYNNMNASILFVPLIFLTGEHKIILQHVDLFFSAHFWILMLVGAFFGFLIGIVTVMQINVTSPLTHNISGTAKACVQTVLALIIYKNPWSAEGMFGVFLVIFGSGAYAAVQMAEDEAKKAAATASTLAQVKHVPSSPSNEPDPEVELGVRLANVLDGKR